MRTRVMWHGIKTKYKKKVNQLMTMCSVAWSAVKANWKAEVLGNSIIPTAETSVWAVKPAQAGSWDAYALCQTSWGITQTKIRFYLIFGTCILCLTTAFHFTLLTWRAVSAKSIDKEEECWMPAQKLHFCNFYCLTFITEEMAHPWHTKD